MKRVAVGAVLVAIVMLLSGCILYPGQHLGPVDQDADNLGGARFSQQQAVPGFDTSTYTLTDDRVDEFRALLVAHDVDPGDYRTPDTAGCTGGVTTRVQMWFYENGDKEMIIDGCAAADGSFEQEATAFFSAIREGDSVELPNADIVSLTFSQSQAIEGFDDGEYMQDNPQQVARFIAMLDRERIVLSDGIDPALAGEPCPGSITTEITAAYSGTHLVVGPVTIGGCSDLSFADEVTALFAEWRESLAP